MRSTFNSSRLSLLIAGTCFGFVLSRALSSLFDPTPIIIYAPDPMQKNGLADIPATPVLSSSAVDDVKAVVEIFKEHQAWLKSVERFAISAGLPLDRFLLEGNVVTEQAMAYRSLAKKALLQLSPSSSATVICETGFFKGVSAHLWMDSLSSSSDHNKYHLHSFDLKFPDVSVNKLREAFNSSDDKNQMIATIVTHPGSTRETLPLFQPEQPCNLLSIDGSHEGWDPYLDVVELLPHTKCGSIVLFDDTFDSPLKGQSLATEISHLDKLTEDNNAASPSFFNACSMSYWRGVKEGLLEHVDCQNFGMRREWGNWPKGYCISFARGGNCRE